MSQEQSLQQRHSEAEKPKPAIEELRLISHSQFFYYWPLWLFSLVFALITAISGKQVEIVGQAGGEVIKTKIVNSPSLGLAYLIIFATVILFTSVNIRGVWAALVGTMAVIFGLVFYVFNWWGPILKAIGSVQFFINFDFYLWMGVIMLALWILVWLYDRRHYLVLRPSQFTVVEEIGEGEKNHDTVGMVFDKKRDNFFQHLLLGFGSGDLKILTAGASRQEIHFPNVLLIGSRLKDLRAILEQRGRATTSL